MTVSVKQHAPVKSDTGSGRNPGAVTATGAAPGVSNRSGPQQQQQQQQQQTPAQPSGSSCRLQLHLSARGLKNLGGLFGTSDPFAVVTVRGAKADNHPSVVGQTDIVFNNLNPTWSRPIYIEGYKFGSPLYFEVGVFDFESRVVGKSEATLARMDITDSCLLAFGTREAREQMRTGKFPHPMMGTALFEVGQVLGARGNVGSKYLQNNDGAVYAHIERSSVGESRKFRLCLSGVRLQNVQTFPLTSSPFYEMFRKVERPSGATAWMSVYRSNTKRFNLSPLWNERSLDVAAICNGDVSRPLKIIVWDHRRTGKHKFMGEFETTLTGLMDAARQYNQMQNQPSLVPPAEGLPMGETVGGFPLIRHGDVVGTIQVLDATIYDDSMRDPSSSYLLGNSTRTTNSSTQFNNQSATSIAAPTSNTQLPLTAQQQQQQQQQAGTTIQPPPRTSVQPILTTDGMSQFDDGSLTPLEKPRPDFVDYLFGGCQISLAVAIDFTASNGNPKEKGTPHYFHPGDSREMNDYEKAIDAVGSILAKHDSDQKFPVWGFGIKQGSEMRNCFLCGRKEEVDGVAGIKAAYRNVFRNPLDMSYPTVFKEVIKTAAAYAQHKQDTAYREQKLAYTILLILTAGDVDEQNLQETKRCLIEASRHPLSVVIVGIGDADFSVMEFLDDHDPSVDGGRDITKFVRFNDYSPENLAEAVLDEIPDQLVTYFFDKRNILPGDYERLEDDDIYTEPPDDASRAYSFLG